MKTIIVGINAKYIHTNLAIRLLKKNCDYDTEIREFSIKDSIDKIIEEIKEYDLIGFSCYIWNISFIKKIIIELKKTKNPIIFLGGPEVSYNGSEYIKNNLANYVIKNEGEIAYNLLRHHLENSFDIEKIPNLYYEDKFTFNETVDLKKIKMAYDLDNDFKNRIIYIETSRGCPYHCSYCMASLDNSLRFFDIEEIKKQLLYMINNGGKVFKFLDRTFNANKKYFISLIDFLILNKKENNSFQFEITGDLLDDDIIKYINSNAPKNLFRFEIGIQSTNPNSNKLVYRIQNNEKLFHNIRLIQSGGKIDLHLDLIAGLPKENYSSFIKTFNDCLSLRPKELQLGFLKILHGTKLESEASIYQYKYCENPPYEIISNDSLSSDDIKKIHITEDAFDKYYNSDYFKKTFQIILDNITNPYLFFYELAQHRSNEKGLKWLFSDLNAYLLATKISNYQMIYQTMVYEYLSFFNLKPEIWWGKIDKEIINSYLKQIYNKKLLPYNLDQLYRYSVLVESPSAIIIAVYFPNKKMVEILSKNIFQNSLNSN